MSKNNNLRFFRSARSCSPSSEKAPAILLYTSPVPQRGEPIEGSLMCLQPSNYRRQPTQAREPRPRTHGVRNDLLRDVEQIGTGAHALIVVRGMGRSSCSVLL
jgi:hypothetical protein